MTHSIQYNFAGRTDERSRCFAWSYDSFGNRLQQQESSSSGALLATATASYNGANQMTTTNARGVAWTPSYDGAGNMASDGANSYLYDADVRVCAVLLLHAEYAAEDGLSLRRRRRASGEGYNYDHELRPRHQRLPDYGELRAGAGRRGVDDAGWQQYVAADQCLRGREADGDLRSGGAALSSE